MSKYRTDSLFTSEIEQETHCRRIIRVAFESAADTEFDYLVPDELWPITTGQRVEVPFGKKNRTTVGFCVEADVPPAQSFAGPDKAHPLKKVARIVDKEPLLDAELMELARWISSYYVCPLGQVLAAMVPGAVKKAAGLKVRRFVFLSESIDETIEQLKGPRQKQIVAALRERKALSGDSAVEMSWLLERIGCKDEPVKNLAAKQIVRIVERATLTALPVIPEGLSVKTETVALNEDQQRALNTIEGEINSGRFGVTLLHGVTDSGKTELYIRALELALQKGRKGLVLLPEIALTAQTVQRFSERFDRIAVMHSGLTGSQRNWQWHKIKSGEADVVVGARSAIFAPLPRLGLIIVDEEHEASYKQDTAPRYNARDVAIKRAQLANVHCILGSATPSLETWLNCSSKKHFSLVRLPKRVMNLPMPQMKLVDLRQGGITATSIDLISKPLAKSLSETLARKEQAILLLNKRGYSSFVFCPSCKHTLRCRNCDVTLTFHKSALPPSGRIKTVTGKHIGHGFAICHYCLSQMLVPEKCPLCGKGMAMIGPGSQRLEEELTKRFPTARVARIDSDSMAGKDYYRLLKDFSDGRIDILAGTQILAKGLHFPNVTLVGIISADTALYLPDFRANERTFQLISQVAGRAGRSQKKGLVLVQTFLPDQPAIKFALSSDFDGFVQEELKHRKACNLPPYWRLATIVMRDTKFDRLEAACKTMRQIIDSIVQRDGLKVVVRGPMPAVISRIQGFHRMQIIVQAPDSTIMHRLFESLRTRQVKPTVKTAIDIDPIDLL